MAHIVPKLQNQLDTIARFIDRPRLLALSGKEQKSLRVKAAGLAQKLERAQSEPLTVGILGGTGVGKSTLLNALAGEEISAASHRRPETQGIVIYRHEQVEQYLSNKLVDIPWKEILHKNDVVGKILLCDLPDFDSIETLHRQRVFQFLEHLDLLIWVTSPEKYADQQFHAFLKAVPKSQKNFYFVLNKLDLIFHNTSSEVAYQEVSRMSQAFHRHLQEDEIVDPLVYMISARDSFNGEAIHPWNQFSAFKRQVFQERRLKEVTVIKANNLDVEIQQLIQRFEAEVKKLETFETTLAQALQYLQAQKDVWLEEWLQSVTAWVGGHVLEKMRRQHPDPVPLVGPGRHLYAFIDSVYKTVVETNNTEVTSGITARPEIVLSTFEVHLESLETKLHTACLRHHLPENFRSRVDSIISREKRCKNLEKEVMRIVAEHLGRSRWPSFMGFKLWQGLCYVVILGIFLLAIGGEAAWGGLLDNPGLKSLGHLLMAVIHTVFSGKGLAALGSYILLNGFLALRFYRRMDILRRKVVEKRGERLVQVLTLTWERQIEQTMDTIRETGETIQRERETVSNNFRPQ